MSLGDLREGQPMNEETAAQLESLLRNISYWIKKKGRDALAREDYLAAVSGAPAHLLQGSGGMCVISRD